MATKVQKKLLELLDEFDSICRDAKIAWTLGDRTAFYAIRKNSFGTSAYEAFAYIAEDDVPLLRTAVEARNAPNRACIVKSIPFPSQHDNARVFYAATDTTLLDFRRSYNSMVPYLSVTVQPAYPQNSSAGYTLPMKDGKEMLLPGSFFENVERIRFEDRTLPVSKEFASAFRPLVNITSGSNPWPYKSYVSGVIESYALPQLPYDDFIAKLDELGCREKAESVHAQCVDRVAWMASDIKPVQAKVNQDNATLELTELRYKFWLKYYPFKKTILRKWATGYGKAVAYALGSYVNALGDFFDRTGKAIYFDRELFYLALFILNGTGYEHIKELRRAVPPEHKKPLIEDKDLARKLCEAARQQGGR